MRFLLAGALLALLPSIASAQFPDNVAPYVQVTSTSQKTTFSFLDGNGFSDLNLNTLHVRVNNTDRTVDLLAFVSAGFADISVMENGFQIIIPGDYRNLNIFAQIRDSKGNRGNDTNQN